MKEAEITQGTESKRMPRKEKPKDALEASQEVPKARRRVLMIHTVEFASLFTKGLVFAKKTRLIEGIPEDFILLGATYDLRLDAILILGESETYDEVPMTEIPPRQMVSIEQGDPRATKKKKAPRKK